jgi:excinuclease ABC subunit A
VRCFGVDDVVAYIVENGIGKRVVITAPITLNSRQGLIEKLLEFISDGFQRVWVDGQALTMEEFLPTVNVETDASNVRLVIDRLRGADDDDTLLRLRDSVARAYSYGNELCNVIIDDKQREFSARFEADGIEFEQPTEHLFSFNNPIGACPVCEGYGKVVGIDEDLVIPDKSKTIYEDAIVCWRGATMKKWKEQLISSAHLFNFPIHEPYYALTAEQKQLLWDGNEHFYGLNTFFDYIDSERRKIQYRVMKARYTGKTTCHTCGGSRLRKEALYVRVGGKNIAQIVAMSVDELISFFANISLDEHDTKTAERILIEIRNRLDYLSDVGLGYLTLDRLSSSLSGGES